MNDRLDSLLSAEQKARDMVDEATREARRIRTGIPSEISAIETEYSSELQKYEEVSMKKIRAEIETLNGKHKVLLEKGKAELDAKAGKLVPEALKLIRSAIEGETR